MKIFNSIIFLLLMLISSCNEKRPLSVSCMENPEFKGKLFVFIGEKIKVENLSARENYVESKFKAKYRVLERICGSYDHDTIDFTVDDGFVDSSFITHTNLLLFLLKVEDRFSLERYQYFDVYKTKTGKWASPYPTLDFKEYTTEKRTSVRPEKIDFENDVSYNIKGLSKAEITRLFPEPYYKIVNDRAVAVYGNYVPELFQLKKDGLFMYWGWFGNNDSFVIDKEIPLDNN